MSHKILNLSLPEELVKQVDIQAERDFSSRSEFIRKAIINQLRSEQLSTMILDRANSLGSRLNIASEQQLIDMANDSVTNDSY